MYASDEARDADIEELAGTCRASCAPGSWAGRPGSPTPSTAVPEDALARRPSSGRRAAGPFRGAAVGMRLREVEIHHADLAPGYTHREWPVEFSALLLDAMVKRGPRPARSGCAPTDIDRDLVVRRGAARHDRPARPPTSPGG